MNYLTFGLNLYKYLRLSYRDIAPKWGISITSRITSTPLDNLQLHPIWYVQGKFYIPGLLNHHSIQLTIGYQQQDRLRWLFSSKLAFPRGCITSETYKLISFKSDYTFPIAYPDLAIGPLLYLKRIRGNLFYDVALNSFKQENHWVNQKLSSRGFDLTADFHFLRIIFPINAGVRLIYVPQLNQYSSQLLLSVDLSNY